MKKLILIFAVLFYHTAFGQGDVLSKRISVNFVSTPLDAALKNIETKAELQFSYNAHHISANQAINYQASSKSVAVILTDILGPNIEIRTKGKYVILQKAKPQEKKDFFVMGYIEDSETGEKITNASIYEPLTLASTLSNRYGYYKIKLPRNQKDIDLRFSKESYSTALVNVFERTDIKMNVDLAKELREKQLTLDVAPLASVGIKKDTLPNVSVPTPQPVPVPETEKKKLATNIDISDELAFVDKTYQNGKEQFIDWFLSTKQALHRNNINDSLYRPFQISLLPFIGTNQKLSPFVANDFSFNVIAGYTGSVSKLEIGSVANIIRKDMTGVQIAGALNVVGQRTAGVQIAGGVNINLGESDGFISSGSLNLNLKNASGVNISGGTNVTLGTFKGVQIAPFNYATRLVGSQIGVFNFSHEAKGTPIGFFTYVHKNGYRRIEIASTELNLTEISFKTGTKNFYNIFSSAFNYGKENKPVFGLGYGLGTSWQYGKRFGSNLDFTGMTYLPEDFDNVDYPTQQFKVSFGLEAKITKHIALFVAPSLNFLATSGEDLTFTEPRLLVSHDIGDFYGYRSNLYTWFGYKFGLRICNKGV
ncbi:hypothetical protein [uncultured Arcticibacterium sp.]|uniref:LA_2272 family surface repeat-containing protein n=1 Tax=uncultured Arcticibacterium sp. TaxID=2173042 RepID=UPI0030FC4401